jgi:hypothetical protein
MMKRSFFAEAAWAFLEDLGVVFTMMDRAPMRTARSSPPVPDPV